MTRRAWRSTLAVVAVYATAIAGLTLLARGMVMKGIRVTCEDLETGESDSKVIDDDWLLVTAGRYRMTHVQRSGNGTAVITVKRDRGGADE